MIRLSDDHNKAASYFTRPLLTVLFLGFSSGLPLGLTGSTLAAWLFESHIDKAAIGLFAVVATPYTLKFLWSPVMDSVAVPGLTQGLGRRRGWMLLTQITLAAALLLMACTPPGVDPYAIAAVAVLVAFLSASQDIVVDAYRVEILNSKSQGQGAAMAQLGYRLGMIASSAGALYLAAKFGWQATYITMAGMMSIGVLTTLLAREPDASSLAEPKAHSFSTWVRQSAIAPFADFMRHPSWKLILAFIVMYKLADAFIGGMTNPFLLDIGFKKEDIAEIVKVYGTIATLIGTFIGGGLTARFGPLKVMFIAGLLHGVTNLLYAMQANTGADGTLLAFATAIENITGGVSAAAFVAYLSLLCNVHYTATQYALLSSLAALGRTWLSTPAGLVAKLLGWQWFFTLSALLALPGLGLLILLKKHITPMPPHSHMADVE